MIRLKQDKPMTPDDEKKLARAGTKQNVILFLAFCGIIRGGKEVSHLINHLQIILLSLGLARTQMLLYVLFIRKHNENT